MPLVPIRAVISDFGGVLTTPLIEAFAAYQDHSGISPEQLGRAMESGRVELEGAHPLFELEPCLFEESFPIRMLSPLLALAKNPAVATLLERAFERIAIQRLARCG